MATIGLKLLAWIGWAMLAAWIIYMGWIGLLILEEVVKALPSLLVVGAVFGGIKLAVAKFKNRKGAAVKSTRWP